MKQSTAKVTTDSLCPVMYGYKLMPNLVTFYKLNFNILLSYDEIFLHNVSHKSLSQPGKISHICKILSDWLYRSHNTIVVERRASSLYWYTHEIISLMV